MPDASAPKQVGCCSYNGVKDRYDELPLRRARGVLGVSGFLRYHSTPARLRVNIQSTQRMKECIGRMLRPPIRQSMDSMEAGWKSDNVALQSAVQD